MSGSYLSREEIDALLEGVTCESQQQGDQAAGKGEVRAYDLSSRQPIVRARMPTMEVVNQRFARNLRLGFFNFIRRTPEVSTGSLAVQSFGAFLSELAVPTNFNIVAVRPLRGNGLIVCEPSLICGVIDTLYGGNGKFQTRIEGRDFSAAEQRVIGRLVNVITEEYKKAWEGIYPIELEYQRSEMQPQFASVAAPGEMVISSSFLLEFGEMAGAIRFCIPYATLEPIRNVLYSTTQEDSIEIDRRWVNLLTREIQAVEVTMVAELARTNTTIEQLLAMKPGDFIELDRGPRIQATVDGVPLFECRYGTHNAKYALRIDKRLRDNDLGWTGE